MYDLIHEREEGPNCVCAALGTERAVNVRKGGFGDILGGWKINKNYSLAKVETFHLIQIYCSVRDKCEAAACLCRHFETVGVVVSVIRGLCSMQV